uniref:Uncharacterized protein n=1 Tax=Lactuca sativa TaxID=4236 RepID=A0A9R1XHF9_LACSA|nr:hypothetical protein LSAT_V11C400213340 [Lactuca sativa]
MNFKLIIHVIVAYHLIIEKVQAINSGNDWMRMKGGQMEEVLTGGNHKKNEISICRMNIEQENNTNLVNRQEFDKVKWNLFTTKWH